MSEMQRYTGSMQIVGKLDQIHTRNFAINTLIQLGEDFDDIYDPIKYLTEEYNDYTIVGDFLFAISDLKEHDPNESFFKMIVDSNGVFQFDVQYYNGGYSLSEAIEHALKEMK